jgi:dienelactone hydrolase
MRPNRGIAALAVVAVTVASGCTVPRPAGDGPLRYRDQVFSNVQVTSDLQYGSAPDAQGSPVALRLDLYRPASDTQTRRPAAVWVHGGGFTSGSKTAANAVDAASTFARLGYVAVSIDYRLLAPPGCSANPSQPVCTTAALEAKRDAQAAVRWLRANAGTYGVDPARIGIGGTSAGAITATLVGLFSEDQGSSGNPGFPSTVGGFVSVAGGLPNGMFAGAGDAWGLLFHGTADTVVPPSWSAVTAAKMLEAGVPAWLQQQEGAGHVPWAQYRGLYLEQSAYFFYLALDLAHAAGQPPTAARAVERQVERLSETSPALDRLMERYPRLERLERGYATAGR